MTIFRTRFRMFVFAGLLLNGCNSNNQPLSFDQVKWREGNETLRFRMKEDLFKNYKEKIIGHHRNDVIELLGPADLEDGNNHEGFILIYGIGTMEMWDQCPCNLDILYDSSGVVFNMSWRDM